MGSMAVVENKDQRSSFPDAEVATAPESVMSLPGSIAMGPRSRYLKYDIDRSEYSEEVADTVKSIALASLSGQAGLAAKLLGLTDKALSGVFSYKEANPTQTAVEAIDTIPADEKKRMIYIALAIVAAILLFK